MSRDPKNFTIEELEFIIFNLLSGVEETQIAKNLGVPVSHIRKIMESEHFNELWDDILHTIRRRIEDKIDKAIDTAINRMIDLMNSTDERIALESAKAILKLKFGNFEGNKSAIVIGSLPGKNPEMLVSPSPQKSIVEIIKEKRKERCLPND